MKARVYADTIKGSMPSDSEAKAGIRPRNGIAYPNGDLHCRVRNGRISRSACVVQAYRQPEHCSGCPANL
ncbi:MAG: hypothetical protein LBQ00_06705 [Syntrophobacterales bacterium]|nr:hypothetical protein [Syntrophobacterales bacterium]